MKLVVDTNILFSYFWKPSVIREWLMNQNLELFAPEYALEEINRHEAEICKRAGITRKEFRQIKKDLAISVTFVPLERYYEHLAMALRISPDTDDIDFFALSMALQIPLWSNEKRLKEQQKLKVYSTLDLLNNREFQESLFPQEETV